MAEFDLVVSFSQLKDYRHCIQKHHFKRVERLEPRRKAFNLAVGDVMHTLQEADALGEDWKKKLIEYSVEKAAYVSEEEGDPFKLSHRLMGRYKRHWKKQPLEFVEVESQLGPFEIAEGIGLMGFADGIVRDIDGQLYVMERKNLKSFRDPGFLFHDTQSMIYAWLARRAGFNVSGVLWDEVRTKAPNKPKILKSGQVSTAKNQGTGYWEYRHYFRDEDLEMGAKHKELLKLLKARENNFFRRQVLPVDDRVMEDVIKDAVTTARRIRKHQHPERNFTILCNFCDYRVLCRAQMEGLDTSFIRKAEFNKKGKRRGTKK